MATTIRMGLAHRASPASGEGATYLWLAVMVVLWGLSWPAMKVTLGLVPPLWLASLRFATGGAALFLLLAVRGQLRLPPREDLPIVLSVGGLQMLGFTALSLVGMQYTDAGRAALLAYTTPLWGVVTAWGLIGQRPSRGQVVALVTGMAGIAVICAPPEMDWRRPGVIMGNGFLLLAALCWSLVILHIRRHRWVAKPIELAPWQMLFATVPLAGLAIGFEGLPSHVVWDGKLLGLLGFIGPIATSACFVISTEHGRRVTTFAMSNITLGVPVIGVLAAALILGERISPVFGVGLALIVAGAVLAGLALRGRLAAIGVGRV